MKNLPIPTISVDYFPMAGGLDLERPALSIAPGELIDVINYEPMSYGGYRRINGIEVFNGKPSPSAANYWLMGVSISGTIAIGNTVTGVTSSKTGVVLQINNSNELVLTKVSGAFIVGETLNVSGTPQATTTTLAEPNSGASTALHAAYKNLAADNYRADISAVPGVGNILGIHQYNGTKYTFRTNAGGTAVDMYKSSSSGWTQVAFTKEISFSAGTTQPADGATLTQGGVTATIQRAVLQSGAWTGDAAGRFIITSVAGGNFTAGAATATGGCTMTLAGAESAITMAIGGRFEFVNYNFTGSADTLRMYGCDGINRAFEFDGTVFVPIATGMSPDTPKFIAAHAYSLFLAFRGSLQFSSPGYPYSWSPLTGASEIGMGDTITGLLPVVGSSTTGALAVFSRNSTAILYGTSSSNYQLITVNPDAGAVAYTTQNMGVVLVLDDRGVRTLAPTQEYGNFANKTITQIVQSLIDAKQGMAIASSVRRSRDQYRLYFTDGTVMVIALLNQKPIGITLLDYGIAATCATSGENTSGTEELFIGSSSGMVYQIDKGTSLDGLAIEAWVRTAYNNQKSYLLKKSYKRVILEMDAEGSANFELGYDMGYGSPDIEPPVRVSFTEEGGGGYWDQFSWEAFTWDAQHVATPQTILSGTADNISLLVYSNNDYDDPWTIQGASIYYIPRRLARGNAC